MTNCERQLKALRAAVLRNREWHHSLGITKKQGRLLAILYKRDKVSTELLRTLITGTPDTNSVAVSMHRLREKIAETGATIEPVREFGYRLVNKRRLKRYVVRI